MPQLLPSSKVTYRKLVQSINRQIKESKRMIERQTVITYWSVGRLMQVFLDHDPERGTGAALARHLTKDTKIHTRVLEQSLQFYRAYPKIDYELPLNWSHYRTLMSIENPAKRAAWEKRTIRENIRTDHLRQLVYESRAPRMRGPAKGLPISPRGLLYHYRLVKADYANNTPGGIMLDCGFDNRIIPPPCRGRLVNKRIVRAVQKDGRYEAVVSGETTDKIYTYKAVIERVVDGDTILTNIDCGFGIWREEYVRLKWIDAPELRNTGGLKAKNWIERELSSCPFVIIHTHKTDKYDRYLADVFFLPGASDPHEVAAKGKHLNQALLDEGLAEIWKS